MSYQFVSPTVLDSGIGAVEKIGNYLEMFNAEKVLVVTDKGLKSIGMVDDLVDLIEDAGFEAVVFDGVLPDPPDVMIDEAIELAKDEEVNVIVSLGGGSSIDTAKAIAISMTHDCGFRTFSGKINAIPGPLMPHIAIPTTSGTGSEVSCGSVISNTELKKKDTLISMSLFPNVAIVDANMSKTMPPHITAATGADAITHLMEALTTSIECSVTDGIAIEGTRMVYKYLPIAVADGNNLEARQKIADAAAMGAIAFSTAMLHIPHAFAHAVGAKWHIPHGVGCAWGLVYGIEFIAESVPDNIRTFAEIFEVEGYKTREIADLKVDLREKMIDFFTSIGISKLGTFKNSNRDDFDMIVEACGVEMELFGPFSKMVPTKEYFYETLEKSF